MPVRCAPVRDGERRRKEGGGEVEVFEGCSKEEGGGGGWEEGKGSRGGETET